MAGVRLGINRLVGDTVSEAQSVEDTGATEVIECGLVLRSIGYQGRDSIPDLLALQTLPLTVTLVRVTH